MNLKWLKIFALIVGTISLISSAYEIVTIKSFYDVSHSNFIEILKGNILIFYFIFSPLMAIGVFISAIGLYYSKRWSYFLLNFCLVIFLGGFLIAAVGTIFPNFLNFSANLGSDKGMAYLPYIDFKAYLSLFIGIAFLIVLNLKSTRLLFEFKKQRTT
jgi:hypothetical protein